jgi:SAM-dependent methyltransferase
MTARQPRKAHFGNWIRARILLIHFAISASLVAASFLIPDPVLRLPVWSIAAIPLGIGLFLAYLYFAFSERGGGVQRRLWNLVLDQLAWDGRGTALDIGTGQGALAIGLAQRFPDARVRGVDLWAANWEYSTTACVRNARALGVGDRVIFQHASASTLPLEDGSMDAIVSHFVFHEVKDGGGPVGALKEAIRVLKPGGAFAFQDMFLDRRLYGDVDALLATLRGWGVKEVRFSRLSDKLRIPWGMGGRRVLGAAGLISGSK